MEDLGRAVAALEADLVGARRAAGALVEVDEEAGVELHPAEVLTLVARGHTNREIADALVISVKTTGHHVSHILHKLDVPTRADAAAIAHRIGAAR